MSRDIDFSKPLTDDEVQYLKDRDDTRWQTAEKESDHEAEPEEPEAPKKAPAKK